MSKYTTIVSLKFIAIFFLFSTFSLAEPPNLTLIKQELITYHDSGEYQKDLMDKVEQARHFIAEHTHDHLGLGQAKKLAIVLDIDETILSNYDLMAAHEFTTTQEQRHEYTMLAHTPAIQPMLELYQEALEKNIAVFFITGRPESEREATTQNLKFVGFKQWSKLFLRPAHYTQKSIVPFKSGARETIAKLGYTIIVTIGDQMSDLLGNHAGKTFKLPNPYYHIA